MKAKKGLAMLLCASMVLSTVSMTALGADEPPAVLPSSETQQTTPVTAGYGDSADSWAAPSIERWSAAGVVKGDQNGNFNHTAKLSCAELAQIFVNLFGLTVKAENTFADLKGDEWYADAILKCVAAGILKGDGTNINAQRDISRQETMVTFGRAVGITPAAKPDLSKFTDAAGVAPWAAGYLAPLAAMGILAGSGDGTINAIGGIDRASTLSLLDKAVATYVTAPGEYKVENANRFVVVNAAAKAGEVVISGTTAGLTVAAGTGEAKVVARDLKADTVKVDGLAALSLEGKSTVGEVVANATGAVGIAKGVTVTTVTANAAAAIANSGTIKALVANAPAAIDNKGTITKADIKADGVVLGGTRPKEMTVAEGTKNPTNSTGKEVKPVAPPTTDDEYIAVAPSITIVGKPRAFQGTLFAEDEIGKITNFTADRVLPFITVALRKGDYNYKNVRLVMELTEADKGKFQAIAIDENGDSDENNDVPYNIVKSGWGDPTNGFALNDDLILVYLLGTEAGTTCSATIKLVDVKNNNAVITSTSISVPVIDITGKEAIIGTTTYAKVTDAGKAAVAGDTVTLLKVAELTDSVAVAQGVVLNVLHGTKLTVPTDKTLTLNGTLANDGTIVNNGTINLAGDIVENGNVINLGTFTNTGTIGIAASGNQGLWSHQNIFLNVGEFTSSGTGKITNDGNFITGLFGTCTLSGGTMTVKANGTAAVGLAGTLTVGAGATVTIDTKGSLYVDETGIVEIKGTVKITDGGKFENNEQVTIATGGKLVLGDENTVPSPAPSPAPPEDVLVPVLSNAKTGTITNKGTIENYSGFENLGTLQIGDVPANVPGDPSQWDIPMIMNEGDLQNHGKITNYGGIANRGFNTSAKTNEGFILNHGTVDNYGAFVNAGTIINEEHEAAADEYLLTEGIIYNHEVGSIINAGEIYIGSELLSGAISNGGTISNVKKAAIYNYDFLVPEVKDMSGPASGPNLVKGPVVNEGEIWLGEDSMLRLDIENKAGVNKTEGTIVVCDALNLAMAVNMGGTVRLDNDIVTADTIVISNAVTLDGDNACLTGELVGKIPAQKSTILIGDGTKQLTDAVVIKNLIVCGPNTTANEWDEGEYAIKAFWASNVTLDSVWMIYANAGMQVDSSTVTLRNDTCLARTEFGGIELANGAGHGASKLTIAEGATIMHIGNPENKPAIWMDKSDAGTITGGDTLLRREEVGEKVYYYVKEVEPKLPVSFTMTDANLKENYAVNLEGTPPNRLEYAWGVKFTCDGQNYQVATQHFKPGNSKPTTKTLQEMQTDLWRIDAGEIYTLIKGVNVMLTIEGNTLTWEFYRPAGMDGAFTEKTPFTVTPK